MNNKMAINSIKSYELIKNLYGEHAQVYQAMNSDVYQIITPEGRIVWLDAKELVLMSTEAKLKRDFKKDLKDILDD